MPGLQATESWESSAVPPRKASQALQRVYGEKEPRVEDRRIDQRRAARASEHTNGGREAGARNSLGVSTSRFFIPYAGYLSLLCRLILGGVFAYAGVSKVVDPGGLAASIRSYGLGLPEWFVSVSAHGLPHLEVLLGLYLMAGLFTRTSAWATNLLMVVFIVALLQGALRGLEIDCGCFGPAGGGSASSASAGSGGIWSSLWFTFVRDLGLLGGGLWIALAGPGRLAVDSRIRQGGSDQPQSSTKQDNTAARPRER